MALTGTPSVQIIVDESRIAEMGEWIQSALMRGADQLVQTLADTAVTTLSEMYSGSGHRYLASRWACDGVVSAWPVTSAVVYNKAEAETFNQHDPDFKGDIPAYWAIDGAELVSILEYGAKGHTFGPRNGQFLRFRSQIGERNSQFKRSIRSAVVAGRRGIAIEQFGNPGEEDSFVRAMKVEHPGVTGNRFIRMTRDILQDKLLVAAGTMLAEIGVK